MKTYVFPGQGSQFKGMGEDLFKMFPELTRKADEILGYSIEELCLKDPEGKLFLTQYTQPALYVVNALTYYKKLQEDNVEPDFFAGHSLGEYNAILAAGGFDFEIGLRLVKKRGELMGQASRGLMAAVIGLGEDKVQDIIKNNSLTNIDIANYNTTTQIVISGLTEDINRAKLIFESEGAMYILLNVSGAFHSRYMQDTKKQFEDFLKQFEFKPLKKPVISNVSAMPYDPNNLVNNLAEQLRSPVRWRDSVKYLLEKGEMIIEEVGPGRVLRKLVGKIEAEFQKERKKSGNVVMTFTSSAMQEQQKTNQVTQVTVTSNNVMENSISTSSGVLVYKKRIDERMRQVDHWNNVYPVGTEVTCQGYEGSLKTRTQATILFGHRAVIYMEGYNGYFALDEIIPVLSC